MANRTVKDAHSIHGTNPQYLVEKIIRTRIYESKYWKEECFGLTAELVVDKAMELRYIGGVYGGNIKPTPFLCLTLKMLQIQPEKDIIVEFIKNEDFKYVRLLGALYMRLTGTAIDCYKYLEPLYNDYRKIKSQNRNGEFELMHVDEFIDQLLHDERLCDIILPRLQKRYVLEEAEQLEPRISALEEDMDDVESSEDEEEEDDKTKPISKEEKVENLLDCQLYFLKQCKITTNSLCVLTVPHHAEKGIAVRAHGGIEADLGKDATGQGLSLQGITVATDTAAIPSLQKDLKRAIRRVVEEMND
ncbi:hypothetical protein lerEdw1_011636 [Lerista edwardsae]|nr:hypothetical protein lerEdw1_011636 [Lerista edwardsae]